MSKSTLSNLSNPESANFFKLHAIQGMSASQDEINYQDDNGKKSAAGDRSNKVTPRISPFDGSSLDASTNLRTKLAIVSNSQEMYDPVHSIILEGNARKKQFEQRKKHKELFQEQPSTSLNFDGAPKAASLAKRSR